MRKRRRATVMPLISTQACSPSQGGLYDLATGGRRVGRSGACYWYVPYFRHCELRAMCIPLTASGKTHSDLFSTAIILSLFLQHRMSASDVSTSRIRPIADDKERALRRTFGEGWLGVCPACGQALIGLALSGKQNILGGGTLLT
jgi:hypothetical protein